MDFIEVRTIEGQHLLINREDITYVRSTEDGYAVIGIGDKIAQEVDECYLNVYLKLLPAEKKKWYEFNR